MLAILSAVTITPTWIMGHMRSGLNDRVFATVTQSDGKTVVAGKVGDSHILRRNPDGSPDRTFSSSWTTSGFNAPVQTLALQADQKILVGGTFTRFDVSLAGHIARLNPDGSIDPLFSHSNGVGFDDEVTDIQVESSGKIRVTGKFEKFDGISVGPIVRLNPDGTLYSEESALSSDDNSSDEPSSQAQAPHQPIKQAVN